jgi:hypothetical protein
MGTDRLVPQEFRFGGVAARVAAYPSVISGEA